MKQTNLQQHTTTSYDHEPSQTPKLVVYNEIVIIPRFRPKHTSHPIIRVVLSIAASTDDQLDPIGRFCPGSSMHSGPMDGLVAHRLGEKLWCSSGSNRDPIYSRWERKGASDFSSEVLIILLINRIWHFQSSSIFNKPGDSSCDFFLSPFFEWMEVVKYPFLSSHDLESSNWNKHLELVVSSSRYHII